MRTAPPLFLILLTSACGSSGRYDEDWELPETYRTETEQEGDRSERDANLPKELRTWKWNVLERSTFPSALRMRKDTARGIIELEERIETLKTMRVGGRTGKVDLLYKRLGIERMRLELVKRHLVFSPLPADEEDKLLAWQRTVLTKADVSTVIEMRRTSIRRIKWLDSRIQELDLHHEDLVWEDYLGWNMLLHFEMAKLGRIDRKLKG